MTRYYYISNEAIIDLQIDTITTEGDDPLLIYSRPDENTLLYSFNVDWDGDGTYDGFNEADYLLGWTSSRGRERIVNPSGRGFQPYEIGRLTVTLDNSSGRYDPWNADSPLYGNLMPGRNIEFKVNAAPPENIEADRNYYIFTGTIVDIQVAGHNDIVNIICEDGWRFLADWDFMRFPYTTSAFGIAFELWFILQRAITFDANTLAYDDPEHNDYPWGLAFSVGDSSTDLPRHWWWDGSAKQAVEMITEGSLGMSWIRKDGQFDFLDLRDITSTIAKPVSFHEDDLLKSVFMPAPWDNMYSEIVLKGSNNYWYPYEKVARLTSPMNIDAGETVNFSLRTSSTDTDIDANICTRVVYVSMTANTASNIGGSDITSDITYTVDPLVNSFDIEATNNGASDGYIVGFEIYGELLEVVDREWRYETTSAYRKSSFILDNPWLTVTAVGSTNDEFEETSTTLDDKARINTIGETLKSYFSTFHAFPTVQMEGHWIRQFDYELEDLVNLELPTKGIDANYRISKIRHDAKSNPQKVLTTYWLYPHMTVVEST